MRQDLWLTARRAEITAPLSLGGDEHPFGYPISSSVEGGRHRTYSSVLKSPHLLQIFCTLTYSDSYGIS